MQQYHAIKTQYPQALILFQIGDFYELFYEDAQKAAAFLHITLTKRGKCDGAPIPLSGFPLHAADQYIIKLVQGGFHLVICDQQGTVEAGKLVERRVTAVLTPGMLHDARLLDERSSNALIALMPSGDNIALWAFELITGRCSATIISQEQRYLVEAELARYSPREVVMHAAHADSAYAQDLEHKGFRISRNNILTEQATYDVWLAQHTHAETYTFIKRSPNLYETGRLLHSYVNHHMPEGLVHVQPISLYAPSDFLFLDAVTQRDLELVQNTYDFTTDNTLLHILDHAATPMGSRMIRRLILRPLCHQQAIEKRLALVGHLVDQPMLRKQLHELLRAVGDLERIAGRMVLQRAPYNDYKSLQRSLGAMTQLAAVIEHDTLLSHSFSPLVQERTQCTSIMLLLDHALQDDAQQTSKIKAGYDVELDKMRAVERVGEQALTNYEEQEKAATGIQSLKIKSHNETYGYGIEVTKANRRLVPERYRLVQALTNRDRFTTPELLQLEHDIQHAQKRAGQLDQELFNDVVKKVSHHALLLRSIAEEVARLDSMLSFAHAAVMHRYVKPTISKEQIMHVEQGRHPVVEYRMRHNNTAQVQHFVANDVMLNDAQRLWIITGPNMGGKSTFLRQTALIAIMAQVGSFVPAKQAVLPIFDRLFTRIGATDRVSEGKSTFWIEMEEVARMCREATPRSLIILDEVGRGTSTYDGMSIAQAVLEHLEQQVRAFGLCATHYHEIARVLGHSQRAIGLYQVATAKIKNEMILLHAIRPGIAESSFGLVVAQRAGILPEIIARAQEVLAQLQG